MTKQNIALIAAVILLGVIPVLMHWNSKDENLFTGADNKAGKTIEEIAPDYKAWAKPVFEPAGELSSMLFALQAAIGAGLLGYAIGYYRGRHNALNSAKESAKNA